MTYTGSLGTLLSKTTGGSPQVVNWYKTTEVVSGGSVPSGRMFTCWNSAGGIRGIPGSASVPTAASMVNPTRTSEGAMKQTNPSGGNRLLLASFSAGNRQGGFFYLLDRLMQFGQFSGTSTGAQTVNGTLSRYTTGAGVRMFLEIETQIGATARTVTATYTNSNNVGSRVTPAVAIGGTNDREGGRLIMLPFQAGDTGAKSWQSFTISASTGTAGAINAVMGVFLAKAGGSNAGDGYADQNLIIPDTPEVATDACLWIAGQAGAAGSIEAYGQVELFQDT